MNRETIRPISEPPRAIELVKRMGREEWMGFAWVMFGMEWYVTGTTGYYPTKEEARKATIKLARTG